jgi:hypothetical protein
MATLFNTKIKDTYQSLLKLEDNTILTTTTKNVTDGLGNASPLYMSTTQVRIGSTSGSAMYWDNVNNRLGVGTNVPTLPVDILGGTSNGGLKVRAGNTTSQNILDIANNAGTRGWVYRAGDGVLQFYGGTFQIESQSSSGDISLVSGAGSGGVGINTSLPTARLHVRGSGSTYATTSLLVQNSAFTSNFSVRDDGRIFLGTSMQVIGNNIDNSGGSVTLASYGTSFGFNVFINNNNSSNSLTSLNGYVHFGDTAQPPASAQVTITSTTRGFLPPRMLQTQRTAIASPAVGLIVYQTDATEGLYIYKSTGWTFII